MESENPEAPVASLEGAAAVLETAAAGGESSGVVRVRISLDQLKSTAMRLERLESRTSKDLYERRSAVGRGGQSAVQKEVRVFSAAKQSRVLTNCSMLSRAVKAAVTASSTSSRKELSCEEERELHTRRRLARHGMLPETKTRPTSTTPAANPTANRGAANSTSGASTHGILGRKACATPSKTASGRVVSSSVLHANSAASTDSATGRIPLDLATKVRPAAMIFGRAFSSALLDHHAEEEVDGVEEEVYAGRSSVSSSLPSRSPSAHCPAGNVFRRTLSSLQSAERGASQGVKAGRRSLELANGGSSKGILSSRLGGQLRGHSASAGILASPPQSRYGSTGPAKQQQTTTVAHRPSGGRGRIVTETDSAQPVVKFNLRNEEEEEEEEEDARLQITIHRKRPRDATPSLDDDTGSGPVCSEAQEGTAPKRKRMQSVVVRMT